MKRKISHYQYKEICLAIRNDLSYEEFKSLCNSKPYCQDYINSIWKYFSEKPIEFVLYHDLGKDVFEFLYFKLKIHDIIQEP